LRRCCWIPILWMVKNPKRACACWSFAGDFSSSMQIYYIHFFLLRGWLFSPCTCCLIHQHFSDIINSPKWTH
jgi:hypothetical protein